MSNNTIHLFRKALRLHDNEALLKAIEVSSTLIPLYILDPILLNPKKVGINRIAFLLDTLKCLDKELRKKGTCLHVAKGRPPDVLKLFFKEFKVHNITFDRATDPYNKKIEDEIMKIADNNHVAVHRCWGQTLFDPDYLLSLNHGKAPLNMASFSKIITTAGVPKAPMDSPTRCPPLPTGKEFSRLHIFCHIPNLGDLGEYGYKLDDNMNVVVGGGEVEAIRRMEEVLNEAKTSEDQSEPERTRLSPYLANGSLSVRLLFAKLKELHFCTEWLIKPPASLESKLYKRELAYLIGHITVNFDQIVGNPICVCMQVPWLKGKKADGIVERWEMGQSGHPSIDATMNQLRSEGWLTHAARYIAACFLTRGDLLVFWGRGKDIFEKYLLDSDWSINNFSWHSLSCDTFFHQFFSSFDPAALSKQNDPTGEYIRKYVPVLKNFPVDYIYEPWLAPKTVQKHAGCIIGIDYPLPMGSNQKE